MVSSTKLKQLGITIPTLDIAKATEIHMKSLESPTEEDDGIEFAQTDADIKPEDARLIQT